MSWERKGEFVVPGLLISINFILFHFGCFLYHWKREARNHRSERRWRLILACTQKNVSMIGKEEDAEKKWNNKIKPMCIALDVIIFAHSHTFTENRCERKMLFELAKECRVFVVSKCVFLFLSFFLTWVFFFHFFFLHFSSAHFIRVAFNKNSNFLH